MRRLAEGDFRRIKGHRDLPKLLAALDSLRPRPTAAAVMAASTRFRRVASFQWSSIVQLGLIKTRQKWLNAWGGNADAAVDKGFDREMYGAPGPGCAAYRSDSAESSPRRGWRAVIRQCTLASLFLAIPALASDDPIQLFRDRIRPILAQNCWACHTSSELGGLRLDSKHRILEGGESGPAVVPGDPAASILIRAISYADEQLKMPPTGKLKDDEIAALKTWVEQGAHWDSEATPATESNQYVITPEQRSFWSFQPLKETPPSTVNNKAWPKTLIDHYILAELEAQALKPVESASKRVLIRRATFDLIGLPPDPSDVEAFLADSSQNDFATVVDRLLASPHFGERWGRYWLDVARYGEDDPRGLGVERYPNAYHYRDWVIDALNDDMPYDLFVKAQIAGDLLEDEKDRELKPALGFFALGPWYYDIAMPPQARANERNDQIDALTQGFLGLTVACARCHDHKYDPIPAEDYYALSGVFASSDYKEYPLVPQSEVESYEEHTKEVKRQEEKIKEFLRTSSDQVAEILSRRISQYVVAAWRVLGPQQEKAHSAAAKENLDQLLLERWITYLGNTEREHSLLKTWDDLMAEEGGARQIAEFAERFQSLVVEIMAEKEKVDEENLRIRSQVDLSQAKVIAPNGYKGFHCPLCDVTGASLERDEYVLWTEMFRQKPRLPKDRTQEAGVLRLEGESLERFLHPEWKNHVEILRADLEKLEEASPDPYPFLMGLSEAEDPVNLQLHIRGNPDNLGNEVPRHFLTVLADASPTPFSNGSGRLELAEAIVDHPLTARVIVNRVWQHLFGEGIVRTPSNFGQVGDRPSHPELLEYLAIRLKESNWSIKSLIREIMLSATYQLSSSLDHQSPNLNTDNRLFWHANRRRLDAEALRDSILYVSGSLDLAQGGPSAQLSVENNRRTIYGTISRQKVEEQLALFDFPSPSITSDKRSVTNVPLQRLFFLNGEMILTQAQKLTVRLEREAGTDDTAKIKRAYRLLFARNATRTEMDFGLDYLERAGSNAWPKYAQALLASTEFIYVD